MTCVTCFSRVHPLASGRKPLIQDANSQCARGIKKPRLVRGSFRFKRKLPNPRQTSAGFSDIWYIASHEKFCSFDWKRSEEQKMCSASRANVYSTHVVQLCQYEKKKCVSKKHRKNTLLLPKLVTTNKKPILLNLRALNVMSFWYFSVLIQCSVMRG